MRAFQIGAPMRNRTADLLLTMETLCLLSYRGGKCHSTRGTNGPRYTVVGDLGESARRHSVRQVVDYLRREWVTARAPEKQGAFGHFHRVNDTR